MKTIIASILACAIGLWKWFSRKNAFKREQGEQAKKDLENAKKNDSAGDFLDAFDRMR